MKRFLRFALAMLALGGAGLAAAEIMLYENDNYSGRTFRSANSVSNLNNSGFNDRASSVVVRNGSWSMCTDAYFRGRCVTLGPGQLPVAGVDGPQRSRVVGARAGLGRQAAAVAAVAAAAVASCSSTRTTSAARRTPSTAMSTTSTVASTTAPSR